MRDSRLRMSAADLLEAPDLWDEVRRRADHPAPLPPEPSGASTARRLVVAAVAFGLFVSSGVLAWRALRPEGAPSKPPVDEPSVGPAPTGVFADLPAGWTELPAPPEVRTAGAATAWTGTELIVWGGYVYTGYSDEDAVSNGFRLDPISGRVSSLPPSPLSARVEAAAAWTGTELLVWGGASHVRGTIEEFFADGAAYDPVADPWRPLPPAPIDARMPFSVWTGSELIVWGSRWREQRRVDGAAYNPAVNTWRPIPDAPIEPTDATAVWTGEEMIVFGAALHGGNFAESETAIGAAYDPETDAWRRIANSELSPQASTAAWNGTEVIAWDYQNGSAAYDPATDSWRLLSDVPLDEYECTPQSVALPDGFVFGDYCGLMGLFDPVAGWWRDVTRPEYVGSGFQLIAADAVALLLGQNVDTRERVMAVYRPASEEGSPVDGPREAEPTPFVPDMTVEGGVAWGDVTFPDGSWATISYPAELDLASLGLQPDVSYVWRADPPPRFPIVFLHGPEGVEAAHVEGPEPRATYALPGGVEVTLWPAVETEFTGHRDIRWWLVYRTPSWSVLVSLPDEANAETVASSLSILQSGTGLPVVRASGPLELAEGFGESEGATLTIADANPAPDLVSDLLGGTIFLSPDGCSGGPEREGDGYGSNCLGGGNVHASIYGDAEFVRAVLSGLRVDAFSQAPS